MNVVQIFQWIGLGGFIAWAVLERGFSLSKQQQTGGLRLAAASYWWISISWYASQFYALADSWMGSWTTFASPLWGLRGLGAALTVAGVALRFLARRELGKQVQKEGEGAKIAIRNIRQDANKAIANLIKDKAISEDDKKRGEDDIQKLTDANIKDVDKVVADKEKELLSV